MRRITVILPCAGDGVRLGADGPKELFEIYPGKRLIDYSIEHIRAFQNSVKSKELDIRVSVIIVIKPGKEAVFRHVSEKLPVMDVSYVMFDNYFTEWPGSVFSARAEFSEQNVVLLPDTFVKFGREELIYTDREGETLIGMASKKLDDKEMVLGVTKCTDPEILSQLGAVRVEGESITLFQDKPDDELDKYSGFWGVYGFRESSGRKVYEFLIDSVEHGDKKKHLLKELNPGVFYIDTYHDLGTVDSVARFIGADQD